MSLGILPIPPFCTLSNLKRASNVKDCSNASSLCFLMVVLREEKTKTKTKRKQQQKTSSWYGLSLFSETVCSALSLSLCLS